MTTRMRSITTRLVAFTAMLIIATVAVVVWQWTATDRKLINAERRAAAMGLATTISRTLMNEIDDANWSQVRVDLSLLMKDDPDIVYVMIHADHAQHRIVAGSPAELNEQYISDLVPADVSRRALSIQRGVLVAEPFLLRDVRLGEQQALRGAKGSPIVEVAAAMRTASDAKIGTVRVGMSLAAVDQAVRDAVLKVLAIAGISLLLALSGAVIVARRLSKPIVRLAADASKIASGDLAHRAKVDRADEIGALATAFNDMSVDLEDSFGKLNQTLASFERFVPRKFLTVVAPSGIENIVVGTAEARRVNILFSDLRGFTSTSEGMTPIEVFRMLNEYLARMGAAIDANGGFVDKYIGDAIMAVFDDEHSDGLLRAIIAMRDGVRAFNAERVAAGHRPIEAGIGAHGGEVVMGTIGFASKIESTVIGDAVNVASRVESMTKDYATNILVTSAIVAKLEDPAAFKLRTVATGVKVRGRDEPIDLFTLD